MCIQRCTEGTDDKTKRLVNEKASKVNQNATKKFNHCQLDMGQQTNPPFQRNFDLLVEAI